MPAPVLHVVTNDAVLLRADFQEAAASVLRAGGPGVALHIRGPSMEGRFLLEVGWDLLVGARMVGARLVVNDRIDVAGCLGADGVQLGQRSLPVTVARRLLGGMSVGVSVHHEEEAREARDADWVLVGSLFETASHPEGTPAGVELLTRVGQAAPGLPRVGIGGITPERVGEVRRRGAAGVAVLSGVWDAPSASEAVVRYLTAWDEASETGTEELRENG
ncbi:MAG: thiamine phosphate synthase [Gemmatimonadota bacterium]